MRFVIALATFVAGSALALVIAYWGWQLFGPVAVRVAPSAPADPAATIIAADLFGGRNDAATAAGGPPEAPLAGDLRLLGIIAEPRQQGYALFRLPTGAKVVAQGQEISGGVTLASVQPDAITVRDSRGEHRYLLRKPAEEARRPSARSLAQPTKSTAASCAPPSGFRGAVVRLNAELLGGLAGNAAPWRTLLAPSNGALVVRENGGFGAMLGLHAGDRIAQANGIALAVPDDVTSAVIRPLMANQGVRLIGSRGGAPQEVWLANVACAG